MGISVVVVVGGAVVVVVVVDVDAVVVGVVGVVGGEVAVKYFGECCPIRRGGTVRCYLMGGMESVGLLN